MSKTHRSKKGGGSITANQRRKAEYAALRGKERAGKTGKRKTSRASDPRAGIHERPCGNPACRECYVRILGYGIVPSYSGEANVLKDRIV